MNNMATVVEECGMEISFSITSLIFSNEDAELYFEGSGKDGFVVLMIEDGKQRARYYATPDGYEIEDIDTGKVYTILDCLEAFKNFARTVFNNKTLNCWN